MSGLNELNLKDTSKYISLILRHKPEVIGITLDAHGWANVDELIAGISKTQKFNMDMLEEIVRTDEKQRYSFNDDKTLIRANQGHSISVDVELEQAIPPKYLYHGTGEKFRVSIDEKGLIPKNRLYVHLSPDIETATKVGYRHGAPVVYRVYSKKMHDAGFVFYKSVNGVWLTEEVPTQYIKRELFDEKEISTITKEIDSILIKTELDDDSDEDISRANVIYELEKKYSWEALQIAIIHVLLDDNRTEDDWYQMAVVLWYACLESDKRRREGKLELKFKKKSIVALIYYRLRKLDYAEHLLWSITCKLYQLNYDDSDFEPTKDEKIIRKLAQYGLQF